MPTITDDLHDSLNGDGVATLRLLVRSLVNQLLCMAARDQRRLAVSTVDELRATGGMDVTRGSLELASHALEVLDGGRGAMTITDERPDDEMTSTAVANLMIVSIAIARHSNMQRGTNTMPCPICHHGTLNYTIAGPRAVAARCSTPGCIVFMG